MKSTMLGVIPESVASRYAARPAGHPAVPDPARADGVRQHRAARPAAERAGASFRRAAARGGRGGLGRPWSVFRPAMDPGPPAPPPLQLVVFPGLGHQIGRERAGQPGHHPQHEEGHGVEAGAPGGHVPEYGPRPAGRSARRSARYRLPPPERRPQDPHQRSQAHACPSFVLRVGPDGRLTRRPAPWCSMTSPRLTSPSSWMGWLLNWVKAKYMVMKQPSIARTGRPSGTRARIHGTRAWRSWR